MPSLSQPVESARGLPLPRHGLKWIEPPGALVPKKVGLAAFDFTLGTLLLTEASTKKRAAIHVLKGEAALRAMDPGGLEVMTADVAAFKEALVRESHTLKRTLTDPHLFSGIGNAYSDEILHHAQMSPVRLTCVPPLSGSSE